MNKITDPNVLAVVRQLALNELNGQRVKPGRLDHLWAGEHPEYKPDYVQITRDELVEGRKQDAVERVSNMPLRAFMDSVFCEPEVHQVLIQAQGGLRRARRLRVDAMQQMAVSMQHWSHLGPQESQAIYVAAMLTAIERSLAQQLYPGSDAGDILLTIVRGALHRLDDEQPNQAHFLRLCMGWGNADEESGFIVELRERMQRAAAILDRMSN